MKTSNFILLDNFIMDNLDKSLTIQYICDNLFVSRSLVREYVLECGYDSFEAMITDYLEQVSISRLGGRDKICAVQEYLFQFLSEEDLVEFTTDNRIVFLYVDQEYQKYFTPVSSFLLQCKHKINPISNLDLNLDPLYQPRNKHCCICTIIGQPDPKELDENQLYRIMHFENKPQYQNHKNVQEIILKKFHSRFENYHMLGVMYILQLYS